MKMALITGASSGIGRALAEEFAKHGINLILVARRTELLENIAGELMKAYSVQVKYHACDLTDLQQIDNLVSNLAQGHIRINFLVNNAGTGVHGGFDQLEVGSILKMIQLNIVSLTYLTRRYLDILVDETEARILNIASTAAFQACPNLAVYAATKAYVLSFSQALSAELKGKRITVTTLCPGETDTEFILLSGLSKLNRVKKGHLPTAAEVAAFGFKQLMDGSDLAIHGWKNRLMLFGQRFASRKMILRIAQNLYK
jgi:uncharacterized protein